MDESPVVPPLAPNLTLREMDLDHDWDIVGPAMDEAYTDHWGPFRQGAYEQLVRDPKHMTPDEEERFRKIYLTPTRPGIASSFWMGIRSLVGYCVMLKLVERSDTGRVGSMFVRPRYRRQGIARMLCSRPLTHFGKPVSAASITDTDAKSFTNAQNYIRGWE